MRNLNIGDAVEYTHYHFKGEGIPRDKTTEIGKIVKVTTVNVGIDNPVKPYTKSNPPILYRNKYSVKKVN